MLGDDDDDGESPGRISAGPVRTWLLLEAERRTLAAILLVVLYLAMVAVLVAWPTPIRSLVTEPSPVPTLFQALVTGVVTAVTLVVSVNQLVLSQELGAVGDQRTRMEESMQFRRDVSDHIDPSVSPPTPASFLQSLVESSRESAERLTEEVADEPDEELRVRINQYTDTLVENADEVSSDLEDAQFGTFEVTMASLKYNYSYKIYEGRTLRDEGQGRLSDESLEALDELIDVLQFFGPAREHFKTLYFQWELTNLSRAMIYTALPALVIASASILLLGDPGLFPGTTLGVENLIWVLGGAFAVSLVPFLVLLSYILRIAVVAKRTLAMGPFVLREEDRVGDDEEDGDDEGDDE